MMTPSAISRICGAVAIAGAALLMSVAVASPASAATHDLFTNCDRPMNLAGSPGDTVVIHMGVGCTFDAGYRWFVWDINGSYVSQDPPAGTSTASGFLDFVSATSTDSTGSHAQFADDWWVLSDGSGSTTVTATIRATDGLGNPLVPGSVVANVYADGPGPSSYNNLIYYGSPAAEKAPPSWYQSVGRHSGDATCPAGWNPSWAQWPNGGQGGYVCDREEYYSLATAEWLFRMSTGKSQPGR